MNKFLGTFCACVILASPITLRAADQSPDMKKATATDKSDKAVNPDDVKVKGRLPQYFSKVGVTPEQRQKIYSIQATYAPRVDALEKQLQDLKAQCEVEARGVLSTDQQKQLDELISQRKAKKSGDVKPSETTTGEPATSDSDKITRSAAK